MTDPVLVLREALDKATEGPWEVVGERSVAPAHLNHSFTSLNCSHLADAQLIVAARNLLPVLLDEVEALRKKHVGLLEIYERHTVALQEERDDANDEAEALRKVAEQVRFLHAESLDFPGGCAEDGFTWPCPTARLLAVLDKEEEK